jgi:hypothetical protein
VIAGTGRDTPGIAIEAAGITARAHADEALEMSTEVTLIAKTEVQRHLRRRRAGTERLFGSSDATAHLIGGGR